VRIDINAAANFVAKAILVESSHARSAMRATKTPRQTHPYFRLKIC
jgi:hypothetical protein